MKRIIRALSAAGVLALALVITLYGVRAARSSDHQDSALTVSRPGADITDVFVWPSPRDASKVVLAMDVWPLITPPEVHTTFFDPGVMYQFKIGNGDHMSEDLVIQFKAVGVGAGQKLVMYGPAKPNMQGVRSTFTAQTGTMPFDVPTDLGHGVMAFAGPREEPFYFDLAQFFKILPDRNYMNQPNPPPPSAMCFRKDASDFFAGFNVLSLVVELPRSMLAGADGKLGRINVWATTSLAMSDPAASPSSPYNVLADVVRNVKKLVPGDPADDTATYTQIERLGRPAVKEATENFKDHDATNRSTISDDALLAASIRSFMKNVAHRSDAVSEAVVKTLIPDAIEADLSAPGPARYLAVETNGKSGLPIGVIRLVPNSGIYGIKKALGNPYRHFGGRDLRSPVIDLSLGAIFGSLVPKLGLAPDDHQETPCLSSDNVTPAAKHILNDFPYIGAPR